MNPPLVFSLLIASKNEENDIRLAIESSLTQTYPHKEVIVVDDSTDDTKSIIRSYQSTCLRLIDGPGKGCCIARNIGIESAIGDVIVFLTADTRLDPDYLERILPYYERGYDWVTVESQSFNLENIYSRFIEMQHRYLEGGSKYQPTTTQGYSVRRTAALEVGLIDGDEYPFNTCRDWSLGKKLHERGYRNVFDRTIVVPHKSPDTLREYWQVRKARGAFAAYQPYFMFRRSLRYLAIKFIAKDCIAFLNFVFILPAVWYVMRTARYSHQPIRDFFLFYWAYFLQVLARCIGEWEAFIAIARWKTLRRH